MMKFYAYVPNENGKEPAGIDGKILFKLKTHTGAIRRAIRILGKNVRVYRYGKLYDYDTYEQIY